MQPFHLAQVDDDLSARAQAEDAFLHRGFAEPRNAVLARRTRLLQFTQQLAHRRVLGGGFEHQIFKVLGHEKIVGQRLFDAFGNLRALLLQAFHAEAALRGVSEVPSLYHGEPVEPLLEDVAQGTLIFGVQLLVLGALTAPFMRLTYPTHDLLKGIEAVGPDQGRPVVVIGERGLGKSHLMAALYHAVNDAASTGAWLNFWSTTLGDPQIAKIGLRSGMQVIGESLHRQRYKFLWDLLLERHPHGTYIKGKWEGMGAAKTDIPSDKLILELLEHTPTMLLLDEFQTWFDGLTNTKQYPWKNWAFNFIQILSEIAKERPDLLVLVISVRNGGSDAYQQVHRVNPVAIDFKAGGNAERIQQDRRRMLLHRLFDNRLQIAPASIEALVGKHVAEYFRLLDVPSAEQERKRQEFTESWPYAPHLLRLLEEQVLIATDAQETRDMIRILANLYKSRGEAAPVLTAADFRLDDDASGIGALLDSVSNEHHRTLRAKAQQNIISVTEAVSEHTTLAPHLQEIVGALWLRSIAVGNLAGAEPQTLQVDITRSKAVDDNAFNVELATIVENSFNIHQDGNRLVFREEENLQERLRGDLRRAGIGVVRQFNRGSLEALAPEFLA